MTRPRETKATVAAQLAPPALNLNLEWILHVTSSPSGKSWLFPVAGIAIVAVIGLLVFRATQSSEATEEPTPATGSAEAAGSPASGAPAAPGTLTIKHGQGETVVPKHPKRVVVFDPVALDMLDALGVEVLGVPDNLLPPHLKAYEGEKYLKLGTRFEPNYEAVSKAKPDLVISGSRSSPKYPDLAKIATTIDLPADDTRFIETVISNTELLASIFDKQEKAKELTDKLRADIAALKEKTKDRGTGLIILTTGGKISAYGPGSRFGAIHTDFGVPVAKEGLNPSRHGESIGSEFIQKTNPDWLFVVDRDVAVGNEAGAEKLLDNELVRQTTAWKKKQVVYLDATSAYLAAGGIQAISKLLSQIREAYDKVIAAAEPAAAEASP